MKMRIKNYILALLLLLTLCITGCGALESTTEPAKNDATVTENIDINDSSSTQEESISEDGVYTSKEDVAQYLEQYGKLPGNFITKEEAHELGWEGGSLEPYASGKCIGGDRFGNREGILPDYGSYKECDIDTLGADSRGAKRIVYADDGRIYYTEDHYETFELLYGEEK